MSLLLKTTITSGAKAGARRRLAASTTDAWSLTAKRSLWQKSRRDYRYPSHSHSHIGSMLGTAWRDQDDDDDDYSNSWIPSSKCGYPKLNRIAWSPTATTKFQPIHLCHQRRFATLTDARERAARTVQYCRPPTSIRSSLGMNHLLAMERSSLPDHALRALTTGCWVGNNFWKNQILSHSKYDNANKYTHQAAFFGTNSDGSHIRNNISRSGIRTTKIPTPPSGDPNERKFKKPEDVINEIERKSKTVVLPAILGGLRKVMWFVLMLPKNIFFYLTHPAEVKASWNSMKAFIKEEIDHYWVGTKLLWADLKTARALIRRTLRGSSLTRRERKQLLRTSSDLFRLVPFSMFLIIPLMEFALPFALKIFPNLLPSTFQDSLKAEENMKRELQSRIAMAKFFQETLEELAKEQKKSAANLKEKIEEEGGESDSFDKSVVEKQEQSASSFLEFMQLARSGAIIPNHIIVQYAHYFRDDLTLDNMPRMQLINMCKYMGIPPYGTESFLRFQLRHRMRSLREDDQRIMWEGIDSLTKMELREACQERGMRSTGLSKDAYKRALQQWLDLSVKQNVPTSLLIMSRTFFLQEDVFEREAGSGSKSLAGLADTISGLDKEVVNEVILDVATSQEKLSDPSVRKIKLEVLMKQNELIEQEQAERREAKAKKKEEAEKEEAERKAKLESDSAESEPSTGSPKVESTPINDDGSSAGAKTASEHSVPPESEENAAKETKKDEDLSAEEMHALSQLVSADPVSKERADLASLKAALQKERKDEDFDTNEPSSQESHSGGELLSSEAEATIAALRMKESVDEALKLTDDMRQEVESMESKGDKSESDDPVVARLKRRIESMVDKIEVQLSDVQVKIGDKLHVLDKDMDGILSVDEIAAALQEVLKRKITSEEAQEIAQKIDDNKDGVFTVQELIQWVETNQLVKFVEEGRDHEADEVLEKHSSAADQKEQQEEAQDAAGGQTPGR